MMGSMFSASSSKEAALRLTGEDKAVRGVSVRVMVGGMAARMNEWLCVVIVVLVVEELELGGQVNIPFCRFFRLVRF